VTTYTQTYMGIAVVIAYDDHTAHRIAMRAYGDEATALAALSAHMPWCTVGYTPALAERYSAEPASLRKAHDGPILARV